MLKGLFGLPLRALEGFINSLFQLMALPQTSPSYSCISKRAKTVDIRYRLPSKGPVAHLVIDATGLKLYGEGEWKQRKYGKEKRRVWRKLHLAVAALKAGQLAEWKRESGYHQRSKAETAMSRHKQLISPKLSLRDYNGQVAEALAGVKVMNKMLGLGMPVRQVS